MEARSHSYVELEAALAFFEKQSVEDSREINLLRAKVSRLVDAGNRLVASSDSGREIAIWLAAVADNPADRELNRR